MTGQETVQNNDWTSMMPRYEKSSADWIREILYYLVVLVLQIRTRSSEDYLGVFGRRNPPCNAEDNLRAGHLVIEAWFKGY